mgnify:CR=1 FL=1
MKLTSRGETAIGLAFLLLVLTSMALVGHIESL